MTDHSECLNKVRKGIIKNASVKVNYVRIDMADLGDMEAKDDLRKTGQRITIGYEHPSKNAIQTREKKSFVGHVYCPFCGGKY